MASVYLQRGEEGRCAQMGGAERVTFTLDQATITKDIARRREAWYARRPSIMRFMRPEPATETPVIAGIPPAESFALSADALEAGQAALQRPDVVVEHTPPGVLRRHKLKSLLVAVAVVGGWFVFL